MGFLLPTLSGHPWAHVEQILADAPADLLEPRRLEAALTALALRHETLRTVLRADASGETRRMVMDRPAVDLRLHNLSNTDAAAQHRAMEALLRADRDAGADPAQAPSWRVTRLDLGAGRARLLWTIHHALIDGTGIEVVMIELWSLLNGPSPEPHPSAGDFSAALAHRRLDRAAAQAVFAPMLADAELASPLPARAAQGQARMAQLAHVLPAAAARDLRAAVGASGATVLNAVQLAWALVLARWTGRSGAAFGLVESGRPGAQMAEVVGCLVATLPMQVRLDDVPDLGAALSRMRDLTLRLRPHAGASQTEIRRHAGRSGAEQLFDTVVMYQRGTLAARLAQRGCGWTNVQLLEEGTALVTVAVHDAVRGDAGGDDGLLLEIEYDPSRLSGDMGARLLDHLARLLQAMGRADPRTPLSDLDMLGPDETADLLALGSPDQAPEEATPCLATRFEVVAAARGDHPAVIEAATGQATSFADLDRRANALAHQLTAAGIAEGQVVGVALPRGTDQIAAMLGVLKTGAAFLMLDEAQAPDYLAGLLDSTGARALIATEGSALAARLPAEGPLHVVPTGDLSESAPQRPAPRADQMAYVIHTSGSTGTPKAVVGLTGALAAHAGAVIARYGLQPQDLVLQFAASSFDVMLEEVWPTLLAGATVVTRDDRPTASIEGLWQLVAQHGVTVLNLPASYWRHLVAELGEAAPAQLPPSLRLLVTGSERIAPASYRQWRALAPGIGFFNAYGPTEATITCAAWRGGDLPEGAELPIGRPLDHARLLLRAPDGTLTPQGGQGELWIGGAAVTGGYLNDPERTEAVFAADPWQAGGRLYRSGDRAAWSPEGQLMFLGRGDRQVKLRGHRIELGQVESVLDGQAGILESHVDLDAGPPARLLAWVVAEPGTDLATVARDMTARLPAYMLPRLIAVPDLPVTASGKIDRRALPRPDPVRSGAVPDDEGHAPLDELARVIAACMAELLEHDHVSVDDDFYDLGGDSLLALRLSGMVAARSGLRLQTTDLMRNATPRELARLSQGDPARPDSLVVIQPDGPHIPVIAVHVLGRNQEMFRPLSAALGPDYPVWGLTVGVPGDLSQIDVRATARVYFDELQTHAPGQPVCLIAVSMASYFAFELARLLTEAGRQVPVLAILDATGPGGRPSVHGVAKLRAHLGQLRRLGWGHVETLREHSRERRAQAQAQAQIDAHPEDAPGVLNMEQVIQANVLAVEAYAPVPIDAPIAVFRADHSFWDAPEARRNGLGWAPVARGGWSLHDLPGTHLSILEPGNVEALAGHLRRIIAAAEAADPQAAAAADISSRGRAPGSWRNG
ncbi:non-ribosomal peptide synthetase [Paracoccus gahaiensis]|uniref:non-ribosomal peptide synthetase n=1 Tax=Paracoccus gahaiensis TaxID=1706839 RepID=UPI00145D3A96|nr:non-ribosomal peptide synthetase [Paracoccus gahaiensis]